MGVAGKSTRASRTACYEWLHVAEDGERENGYVLQIATTGGMAGHDF